MARTKRILVIAASAIAFIGHARADRVQPTEGHPVCLKRVYSEDHMRRNPNQKLSSLYVRLTTSSQADPSLETARQNLAKVIGVNRNDPNRYYANGGDCQFRRDGSVFCAIECDGGSFSVHPRNPGALFRVTPNYYYPLIKDGKSSEDAQPDEILELSGNDRHNNAYRVYRVNDNECEQVINRLPHAGGSNCLH